MLPYELAWLLRVGEPTTIGSTQTQEITPLLSAHPGQLTQAYLRSLWRPAAVAQSAVEDWTAVQAWAVGYGAGETNGDGHLARDEDASQSSMANV